MLKTAVGYQTGQFKKPLLIFYAAILFNFLLTGTVMWSMSITSSGGNVNGIDLASMIFIFVLGLNSFKENYFMFMQSGRSRKSLFISYLLSLLPVCGLMAIMDNTLATAGMKVGLFRTLFLEAYGGFSSSAVGTFFLGILWSFCVYIAFALAGYMITTFYYRASKGLKIIVSVGVPGFLFVGLPWINHYFAGGALARFTINFLMLITGARAGKNPFYPIGFSLAFAAAFAVCSYLLIRRSVVKTPS